MPLTDSFVKSKSWAKEHRQIFFLPCYYWVSFQLYTWDNKKLNTYIVFCECSYLQKNREWGEKSRWREKKEKKTPFYLMLYSTFPVLEILSSLLSVVTSWKFAPFSLAKNKSGFQIESNIEGSKSRESSGYSL